MFQESILKKISKFFRTKLSKWHKTDDIFKTFVVARIVRSLFFNIFFPKWTLNLLHFQKIYDCTRHLRKIVTCFLILIQIRRKKLKKNLKMSIIPDYSPKTAKTVKKTKPSKLSKLSKQPKLNSFVVFHNPFLKIPEPRTCQIYKKIDSVTLERLFFYLRVFSVKTTQAVKMTRTGCHNIQLSKAYWFITLY